MRAELPPPSTIRWTIRRKAAILAAVQAGEITIEEVCRCYQLSEEEFLAWQRAFEAHGLPGLRVTRLQRYRNLSSS
jgi:transposase-like protein